jgi:hypothetical protein
MGARRAARLVALPYDQRGAVIAMRGSKSLRWSGLCLVLVVMAFARPGWAEAGVAAPEAATQVQLEANADAPGDPSATQDDQLQIRLSLPTESDREAWQKPGLRVFLGGSWQQFSGLYGAPSGNGFGAVMRIGARLDRDWSLLASFHYGGVSATKGLAGLRYAGTIDPTWHITPNFDLAVGMGVGGIVEGRGDRPEADLDELASLATSRTWASARTPFGVCQGAGLAGLVRGGWMTVLGPLSSLGISVELAGQWTACQQTTTRAEADTARPIVRRQWWAHSGAIAGLVFAWR